MPASSRDWHSATVGLRTRRSVRAADWPAADGLPLGDPSTLRRGEGRPRMGCRGEWTGAALAGYHEEVGAPDELSGEHQPAGETVRGDGSP